MNIKGIIGCGLLTATAFLSFGQYKTVEEIDAKYLNWYNQGLEGDKVPGAGVERAYNDLLKSLDSKKTIVVAVLDGGVEVEHEDLKDNIWINADEIPGNGIDDDKNGYIDDIHGWNFLGNSKGENINEENLEFVRILKVLKPKYEGKSEESISKENMKEYELYKEISALYDEEMKGIDGQLAQIVPVKNVYDKLAKEIGKEDFTVEDVKAIDNDDLAKEKAMAEKVIENGFGPKKCKKYYDYFSKQKEYYLNLDFDGRAIIGDDINNINDKNYGNPDVGGPDAFHGTFVGGIIGAVRNNGKGVNGIATNVRIMGVRAVPNGDEYDKDIALGIRYAVDNGANIINMSFGKKYSPNKHMVDEAIKYAAEKGVLLVAAAGNDHLNVEEHIHYPIDDLDNGFKPKNYISVGASSIKYDADLPGTFSNYGKKSVDLFAPGVDIVSTSPGSMYYKANGTSFACPVVSGVAALVWSYYPELTAEQLKKILLKTVVKSKKIKTHKPGDKPEDKSVKFGKLSKTGGLVDAYKALILAKKIAG